MYHSHNKKTCTRNVPLGTANINPYFLAARLLGCWVSLNNNAAGNSNFEVATFLI